MGLFSILFGPNPATDNQTEQQRKEKHDNDLIEKSIANLGCSRKDVVKLPKETWDQSVTVSFECIVKDKYQLHESNYEDCYIVGQCGGIITTMRVRTHNNNIYVWRNVKIGDKLKVTSVYYPLENRLYNCMFDIVG